MMMTMSSVTIEAGKVLVAGRVFVQLSTLGQLELVHHVAKVLDELLVEKLKKAHVIVIVANLS